MNRVWKSVLVTGCGILCGCSSKDPEARGPIPLGQLPAAVVKAAQKRLPDVTFDSAIKDKVGKRDVYEVHGKDKAGKPHKIELSREGTIISAE